MEDADDLEVPPPAYEFCQQEFDQKLHRALEASQNDQQQTHTADGDDEFEVWDEAVFATAAAQLSLAENNAPDIHSTYALTPMLGASLESTLAEGSRAGGSSLTGVQPLRITKKRSVKQKSAKEKERPSWYTEAQLEEDPITTTTAPAPAAPVLAPLLAAEPSSLMYDIASSTPEVGPSSSTTGMTPPMERSPSMRRTPERESTPPPEFTEVGPDLNGPPYEPYDDPEPRASEVVLTYVPGDSNPPSPLVSPTVPSGRDPFLHDIPPISIAPPSHRRALPQLPSQSTPALQADIPYVPATVPPRLPPSPNRAAYQTGTSASSISLKPHYGHTRLSFDPQMAYNSGRSQHHHHASEDLPRKADAAPFYT
ncbi:hypothetical protein EIP86_009594 [Pleurotus ostreatoroseus]|nr:hypothetical protein EIP86_009594 [Pleurotus ostreatoroseus]